MTDEELIAKFQARVAAGEIDLRPFGELIFGKFDQDWPARLIALARRGATVPGKFCIGDRVQRCDMPDGRSPAYRFPGVVCGWYKTPEGKIGYSVSRDGDPGCIQNFAEHTLEQKP